jgi:hypothetical protein
VLVFSCRRQDWLAAAEWIKDGDKVAGCLSGRVLHVALVLLAVTGVATLAEVSTLKEVYVTTTQDRAVTFAITAADTDIDSYELMMHPILFELVEGPRHGTLDGGLEDTHYQLPDKASVTVTYQPDVGFVGNDAFTVAVIDPDDEDSELVTVTIEVSKVRGVQRFAGTWDSEMGFDLQLSELSTFTQRVTALFQVDALALKGVADLALVSAGGSQTVSFDALRFEASAMVGGLNVNGVLAFDPDAISPVGVFDYLLTNASGHVGDVFVAHTLYLTDPLVQSYQGISLQGSVAGFALGNTTRLSMTQGCGFVFSRNDTQVRWEACDVQFHASLDVSDAGFQTLSFGADGILVPWGSWLPQGITLNAAVAFTTTDKTFSLSTNWRPEAWACVRLFGELNLSGTWREMIDAISLYGFVIECDVADGVHVKSATSLDPAKNVAVTGQAEYFEVFAISGDLASCCNAQGTWSVATYFKSTSTVAFDWGKTQAEADVVLSDHLTLGGTMIVRAMGTSGPTVEVVLSWAVRW